LRFLIIADMREQSQFEQWNIRKSIHCTLNNYKETISSIFIKLNQSTMPGAEKNENDVKELTRFKSQYPNDDLKRILFILPEGSEGKNIEKTLKQEAPILSEGILEVTGIRVQKYFTLDTFEAFR